MMIKKLKNRISVCILTAVTILAAIPAVSVYAESGTIYSCTINRSYSNPVTGEVEDSGGEGSYATGQGMVEGCVYGSGMLEVTDSGNYYLTVRLGLIDYTSNQSFAVQNVGDSGWMSTSTAITGNGSDSNGTTADLCIQVPSENCIVRGSMYVSPMGRDVIFYFYPSNYSEGNSVGMNPAFVTETGGSTQEAAQSVSENTTEMPQESTDTSGQEDSSDTSADTQTEENSSDTGLSGDGLQEAVAPGTQDTEETAGDKELNSAQGLSLSTEEEAEDENGETALPESGTLRSILVLTVSITAAGLILMLVAALLIWYFRKNWRRWGGEDDDEDYDE